MNKKQNKLHLLAGLAAALMGAAAVNGVCGEFAWLDPAEFNKDLNSVEVPAAAQPDRAGPSAFMEGGGGMSKTLTLGSVNPDSGYSGKSASVPLPDNAAQAVMNRLPGNTPYEKVKNLFEKGVPATRADLTGWKAGRQFLASGEISASILIKNEVYVPSGGPLFQSRDNYCITRFVDPRPGKVFAYDELKYSDAKMIMGILQKKDPSYVWEMQFPKSVAYAENETYNYFLELRKADGYIVAIERNTTLGGEVAHLSYSYYFKDVTPNK